MKARAVLAAAVMVALALAGCAGDATDGDDEADFEDLGLEHDADTGIIKGVVFDDAVRPIAGAAVTTTVAGQERTTTTTGSGAFGFDKLPPGTYAVTANKTGYFGVTTQVDVAAGVADVDITKILLELDRSGQAFFDFEHTRGYIECYVFLVTARTPSCGYFLPRSVADETISDSFNPPMPPDHVQGELAWEKSTELGNEMSLQYVCTSCGEGGDGNLIFGRNEGTSPVLTIANTTMMAEAGVGVDGERMSLRGYPSSMSNTDQTDDEMIHDAYGSVTGEDCAKYPSSPLTYTDCIYFGGVGVLIQQDFEVFTHLFYRFTPEEGWRFLDDGHPEPPSLEP